jgi:rhodanese-related sulfurtransferase
MSLKKLITASVISLAVYSPICSILSNAEAAVSQSTYGEIDARGLKILLDSEVSLDLLDARRDKYFHGELIPGAKRLPSDSTPEQIASGLPHKSQLIVVYCAGEGCAASQNLCKTLLQAGYQNVIEFPGGEKEWKAQGYKMVRAY